jgi:hypothetical protein
MCLEYIMFHAASVEERFGICRSNSSLFVLVGNPGVIWHPESDQCVHTKLNTKPISYGIRGGGPGKRSDSFCSLLESVGHLLFVKQFDFGRRKIRDS